MRTFTLALLIFLNACAENNMTPNQRSVLMGVANGLREYGAQSAAIYSSQREQPYFVPNYSQFQVQTAPVPVQVVQPYQY